MSEGLRWHAGQAQAGGRYPEAEALYSAAVEADPQSAQALHDLGGFNKLLGRLDIAEANLRAAHKLAPDDPKTRHALGIVLLSQGRYREGWSFYDARHEIEELGLFKPHLPFPEWNGEEPAGKRILIFPEQGLGDQIQFARFAPWLGNRGADITLLCHPALTDLFRQGFGVRVISASGEVDVGEPDYWVMSGSVAGRSGLQPDQLPNAPYLRSSADDARPGGHIGVAVRGNPAHANDVNRSLPPALGAELLSLPGAVSLHPEDSGAKDFADTAALIAQLDLVVSVDTSVAHLAAAMGKPTWILLPRLMTDWRWLEGRTDSPWYPSARLFRQPVAGDWESVLAQVRVELGRGSPAATPGPLSPRNGNHG